MKKGVTLMEILVVIAILAIMVGALSSSGISGWGSKYNLRSDIKNLKNHLQNISFEAVQSKTTQTIIEANVTQIIQNNANLAVNLSNDIEFFQDGTSSGGTIIIDSDREDYRFTIFGATSFIAVELDRDGTGNWQEF
jgi:prepilin-type N-terminal cleavage/methylation domain-containing protein